VRKLLVALDGQHLITVQRLKILIFTIALTLRAANVAAEIVPPRDVQELVKPILDICAEAKASQGEHQNGAFWQAAKLIGTLTQMRTKASDEALVVLMNFYVGESTGGDVLHQVTVRGKRMLPLLLKYRNSQVVFSNRTYPSSLLLALDVRKQNFDDAINNVRAGKIIGED
jgi:hypothetical protein